MLTVRWLRRPGLHAVSFAVKAGECLAVQGPSGSGKTLLLRALADLDPNRGEITLNGAGRETFSGPLWRRRVVYLPANSGWWSEYVGDHFTDWEKAIPLLKRLGFSIPVLREWFVQRLSTGERQRLALVRALVLEPQVLLLDEPTSGLDPETTSAVEQIIQQRLQLGIGVIWVTHDTAQARRMAKRCLFLKAGHVRAGTP
jgi:phosphate-transporting ATPase